MNEYQERALKLQAAWQRIRRAEDLQARWVNAADVLEQALDADLDRELLDRFENIARQLALDVTQLEPEYAALWKGTLASQIAHAIAWEARGHPRHDEHASELFDLLTMDLVEVDPDELERRIRQIEERNRIGEVE